MIPVFVDSNAAAPVPLSKREIEVLLLICDGFAAKRIGAQLDFEEAKYPLNGTARSLCGQ